MFSIYFTITTTSKGYLFGCLHTYHKGKLIFSKVVRPSEEQHWLDFISRLETAHQVERENEIQINSLDPDIVSHCTRLYYKG